MYLFILLFFLFLHCEESLQRLLHADRRQFWSLCLVRKWYPDPRNTVVLVGDGKENEEQCDYCHWPLFTPRFIQLGRSEILETCFTNGTFLLSKRYVILDIEQGKFSMYVQESTTQYVQIFIPQIWPRSDNADFDFLSTLFSQFDIPLGYSTL